MYYKLAIEIPEDATSVECYKLNDDSTTTQLYDGDKLEEGWEIFTVATPSTIIGKSYTVPEYPSYFKVTANVEDLADYTWAEIANLANLGVASSIFNIGDTKEFTCTDGWVGTATIIGFNHDTKTDGGLANITFDLKYMYKDKGWMNATNTNVGGWEGTEMRNTILPAILATFPDDIRNNIKAVKKSTGVSSGSTQTTSDELWLLSMTEVGLEGFSYDAPDNSTVYDYYSYGGAFFRNKSTFGNSIDSWYTRSPHFSNGSYFCSINDTGGGSFNNASVISGIVAGFCL